MFPSGRDRRGTNPVNLVVLTMFPSPNTMALRKQFHATAKGRAQTLGPPGVDDQPNKFLGVKAWAPVFANRDAVKLARRLGGSIATERCHVYTSFNACRITNENGDTISQAAFEAQHVLMGVTTDGSQITFGDVAQEEERVGVCVHGLMHITNRGWSFFSPGMPVTYKLRAVDETKRTEETEKLVKAMTKDYAGDQDDMSPLIVEWRPYELYIANAVTGVSAFLGPILANPALLSYAKQDFMNTSNFRPGAPYEDETLEMSALGMEIAKMAQSFGLVFLQVLLAKGVVVPAQGIANDIFLQALCDQLFGTTFGNQNVNAPFASDMLSSLLGALYTPSAANAPPAPPPAFGTLKIPPASEYLRKNSARAVLDIIGRLHNDAATRLIGRAGAYAKPGDQMALYK
jgi:hypothetical protein